MKKQGAGCSVQRAGGGIFGVMFLLIIFCTFLLSGCGGGGGGDTGTSTPTTTTPGGNPTSGTGATTSVSIYSSPSGMYVSINDVAYGTTPLENLTSIAPGTYTLKFAPQVPNGEQIAPTKPITFDVVQGQANTYTYSPSDSNPTPNINWRNPLR